MTSTKFASLLAFPVVGAICVALASCSTSAGGGGAASTDDGGGDDAAIGGDDGDDDGGENAQSDAGGDSGDSSPSGPVLCRPCATDVECGPTAVCGDNYADGKKYCATRCNENNNGSDCPSDFRCTSAAPKPGGGGYVSGCLPSSGYCTKSACGATCCVWPDTTSTKCVTDSDCCVGSCGGDGKCGCAAVGQGCVGNIDCCSGGCNGTSCVCSHAGSRCVTSNDCCAGTCDTSQHICH